MSLARMFFVTTLFLTKAFAADVFVNQVGYLTNLPKYFYYPENADSFYVVEQSSGTIYFRGKLVLSIVNDPATALTLYKGDFSGLERAGTYFIQISNGDISFSFNISPNVFRNAADKSLKGFYYQRCGMQLASEYAGVYQHPACHLNDATLHSSTEESGYLENIGGWHDAGDFGKYVVNAGITVGTLLIAYEYFPDRFSSDSLNIPESGNGVPDILDEVRYQLEWLLKMQKSDGGVYFKLTGENFSGFIMPQNDNATRYIYQVSSTATGDFAAMMARASRLYSEFDTDFADRCIAASVLAWEYLLAHPDIVPTGGFRNPAGTYTGQYGDSNDRDERLWASAELFETTGDTSYHSYFVNNYTYLGIVTSTMWWGNVKNLAMITYLLGAQSTGLFEVKNNIGQSLINYCNSLLNKSNSSGFGVTLNPGEYSWGCNSVVLNNAIMLLAGYELSNNQNFYNSALMNLNYILGTNVHNKCFVTGLGSNPVMNPHHRPSASDDITDPVPGLIAGGPDQYLDDPTLQSLFNSSTPPALCYVDDVDSYASNEIAINWNAPLVFVLGYFNKGGVTDIRNKDLNILPEEYKLHHNFPNPFNPLTTICYSLPKGSFVSLNIYNITGELVRRLVNEYKQAGNYEIGFEADNLPSGIYFYQLLAGSYILTKKMVLLK
jgi:endoglucanase